MKRLLQICALLAWASAWTVRAEPAPWPVFQDETPDRLVALPGLVLTDPQEKDYAWGDVDRDGDIDLIIVRKEPWNTPGRFRNVLLLNEGTAEGHSLDGVLVDRTQEYATDASDGGQGFLDLTADRDVVLVDVDDDGWLDVVTATTYGEGLPKEISHPRVYINQQRVDGVWQGFRYEVERTPEMPLPPNFCGIGVGDVTGDDLPDLYFVEYNNDLEDRLWINTGGSFKDVSESRLTFEMLESDFGVHAVIADMNGDGVNDIVKDRGSTASTLPLRVTVAYNDPLNEGFFDVFETVYDGNPYFVAVGDLNGDGLPDLVVEDDGADRFFLNQGNGVDGLADFISYGFSPQSDSFGGNVVITDVNNDGLMDVVIADVDVDCCGCDRSMLTWRNLGDGPEITFDAQDGGIPLAARTGTHDVAIFDINGDGWKDMVIGTCSGTSVWMAEPLLALSVSYPGGLPERLDPGQPTDFAVELTPFGGAVTPGSETIFVSVNEGPFTPEPLLPLGESLYQATLPAADCLDGVLFYIAADVGGALLLDPADAPASFYSSFVATGTEIAFEDDIEGDVSGWTVVNTDIVFGGWEQATPIGTLTLGGQEAAPFEDAEPAAGKLKAFVTENGLPGGSAAAADVDGGPTELISPAFNLDGTDATISYSQWLFSDDFGQTPDQADVLVVSVSGDNGASWTPVETTAQSEGWERVSFRVGDFVAPSSDVRLRFSVADSPNNSITEAGIDLVQVERYQCLGGAGGGRVPDGTTGMPLTLSKQFGELISLSWGPSCQSGDDDYEVYEGTLGSFESHTPRLCSTSGGTTASIPTGPGNVYYLIVPSNGTDEGSYGEDSLGADRPPSSAPCLPQAANACE